MKFFYLLAFVVFATSCNSLKSTKITYGKENKQSIEEYLGKHKVAYNINDIAILKNFNAFAIYNNNKNLVVPEAYFFNKDGFMVTGLNKQDCPHIINDLEKINSFTFDEKETIAQWLTRLSFLDEGTDASASKGYDGYVLINWAIFADKFNNTAFNWYESVKANKNLNIKVLLVNIDVQSSWQLDDYQRKVLGL